MRQIPKPIDSDYFDINVICWSQPETTIEIVKPK